MKKASIFDDTVSFYSYSLKYCPAMAKKIISESGSLSEIYGKISPGLSEIISAVFLLIMFYALLFH